MKTQYFYYINKNKCKTCLLITKAQSCNQVSKPELLSQIIRGEHVRFKQYHRSTSVLRESTDLFASRNIQFPKITHNVIKSLLL